MDHDNELQRSRFRIWPLALALFCLFFALELSTATILPNQLIYQTCTVILGHNETDCQYLGSNNESDFVRHLEAEAQRYVTKFQMAKSLIENLIPAAMSLFIGPWSDKFGRKPLIVASFTGYMLQYVALIIVSIISNVVRVNPWFYISSSIVLAFGGGLSSIVTGCYAYMADTTVEETREASILRVQGALFLGLLLGAFSSSYIYELTNALTIFSLSTGITLVGLLSVIFGITESVDISIDNIKKSKFRELFRIEQAKDLFVTCFKARANKIRLIIFIVMTMMILDMVVLNGSDSVFFLFLREKLSWTIEKYTNFIAYNVIIMVIGVIVSAFLLVPYGVSGLYLITIGNLSGMLNYIVVGFANRTWQLYLSTVLGFLKTIPSPMMRAFLTSIIEPSDIGKIMSLTTTFEALSSVVGAPLYTLVYNATIENFPSAFNFISAGIFLICSLGTILVGVLRRRYSDVPYTGLDS